MSQFCARGRRELPVLAPHLFLAGMSSDPLCGIGDMWASVDSQGLHVARSLARYGARSMRSSQVHSTTSGRIRAKSTPPRKAHVFT